MKQFLLWWWPTIGLACLVAVFVVVTFREMGSPHGNPALSGLIEGLFAVLLTREVRKTRREQGRGKPSRFSTAAK